MAVEALAPGKAILFGEHSVVYKGAAIVLAIDKKARVVVDSREDDKLYFDALDLGFSGFFHGDQYLPERGDVWRGNRLLALKVAAKKTMERIDVKSGLNFLVRSEIPIAAGLGSSAAICVATVAAINELFKGGLSKDNICELAYEGEKIIHGTPSGVDNSISTYGGIIRYERGKDVERFKLENSPPFVIGNTKRKRSTKRLVNRVRRLKERNPSLVTQLIDLIAEISEDGLKALKKGDNHKLGDLMNLNHGLLASLGVSIAKLDLLVHASRTSGAYGAKLTGAGGGGCMIAVSDESKLLNITKTIRMCRGIPYIIKISYDGVTTRRTN